jgi:hypothetical protein
MADHLSVKTISVIEVLVTYPLPEQKRRTTELIGPRDTSAICTYRLVSFYF